MRIERIEVWALRAPIATPVVSAFGRLDDRPAVILAVTDDEGVTGWGEVFANFPGCGAEHRARLVETVLAPRLVGRRLDSPVGWRAAEERALHPLTLQTGEFGPIAQTLGGVDLALNDLAARRAGLPLARFLNADAPVRVPAYASGINPDGAADTVQAARERGHCRFKVKLGFGMEKDLATLEAVVDGLGGDEALTTDANQAWTLDAARAMAERLNGLPLAWLEEPMLADRPWSEWGELAGVCKVPLAGGENLRGEADFATAIEAGHLRVLQPDLCKWGGITGCLEVARAAVGAGRIYCPHMLGAGVGLVASAHLLAAAGGPGWLEMDVNPNPLREDLLDCGLGVEAGIFTLPEGSGLGAAPRADRLAAHVTHHGLVTA